jgi:hypothetical protein
MNARTASRRDPRYEIPIELEIPALSDTPIAADNVSASGFHIIVPYDPQNNSEVEISFKVSGMSFEKLKALKAWSQEDKERPGMYHVGLLMLMDETERKKFFEELEKQVAKNSSRA